MPPELQDPLKLLVMLDGRSFAFVVKVPTILDNLLANGQMAPAIAALDDNPGATWKQSVEIRETELLWHAPFAEFLAGELVPSARERFETTIDPARLSLPAAAQVVWRHRLPRCVIRKASEMSSRCQRRFGGNPSVRRNGNGSREG